MLGKSNSWAQNGQMRYSLETLLQRTRTKVARLTGLYWLPCNDDRLSNDYMIIVYYYSPALNRRKPRVEAQTLVALELDF